MSDQNPIETEAEKLVREEFRFGVWLIGLGIALIAYAHATFATKDEMRTVKDVLKTLDQRVYDIHKRDFPEKHQGAIYEPRK